MAVLYTDADVLTRRRTAPERTICDREYLYGQLWGRYLERSETQVRGLETSTTTIRDLHHEGFHPDVVTTLATEGFLTVRLRSLAEALADESNGEQGLFGDSTDSTRMTTATTVSSLRHLLRGRKRDERLRRLSPERRGLYDRIRRRREEMEPISFDVVKMLRRIREHG